MKLASSLRSASRLPGGPILSVRIKDDASGCVLGLYGDLDSRSTIGLHAEIDQLQGLGYDEVVIDLKNLRSIDAAGFAALLSVCRELRARGRAVRIIGDRHLARRSRQRPRSGSLRLTGPAPNLLFGD